MKIHLTTKREGVTALPLFLFADLLLLLLLCSCSARTYVPNIPSEFNKTAVYSFDGFSFSCSIISKDGCVSVTALNTRAEGLQISCDGQRVTFRKGELERTFLSSEVDKTNPALVLYQVVKSLPDAIPSISENNIVLSGKTDCGEYQLTVTKAGDFVTLCVAATDISIDFQPTDA